jgi:hypothetical protein
MYQWCKARQASRHERKCPENAKRLTLEFGIYHYEDGKHSENSNLPIKVSFGCEMKKKKKKKKRGYRY